MTEAPSSYDPLLPLRRALIFWRVCLLLPFGYLGLGMLIEHFLFRDGRAGGMLNLR
ncbi:hypothetical protein HQ520_02385, partial [bacterium]|nr:hypothetical protein [bacterium]